MAIHTKTVEYAFPFYKLLIPDNTLTSIGTIPVYIPETTNRFFRKVILEIYFEDLITATGGTIGNKIATIIIDGVSSQAFATTADTQTGENITILHNFDVTDAFKLNFSSGTEKNVELRVKLDQTTGSGLGTKNLFAKLIITYDYDTSETIRLKTIKIPFNSSETTINNTPTYLGRIPDLSDEDNYGVENSKNYKNVFFTLEGNNSNTGAATTEYALGIAFRNVDDFSNFIIESGFRQTPSLVSSNYIYHCVNLTGTNTLISGTQFDIFVFITGGTPNVGIQNRFGNIFGILTATYTYNESASNKIINSLIIPLNTTDSVKPSGTVEQYNIYKTKLNIQESGLNFLDSAGIFYYTASTNLAKNSIYASSNNIDQYRIGYISTAGSVTCGQFGFCHKTSSNALFSNSGINLFSSWGRGENEIFFNLSTSGSTSTIATLPNTFNGYFIINYSSDKHPLGSHKHNSTIDLNLLTSSNGHGYTTLLNTNTSGYLFLPDINNYYIQHIGFKNRYATSAIGGLEFGFDTLNEFNISGHIWKSIVKDFIYNDSELLFFNYYTNATQYFTTYKEESIKNKANLFFNNQDFYRRFYQRSTANVRILSYNLMYTLSSIRSLISGNIINYTGDGSNITVDIFKEENDEYLMSLNTNIGGMFSGTWFDDTMPLYAVAKQDDTRLGRSNTTYAIPFTSVGLE